MTKTAPRPLAPAHASVSNRCGNTKPEMVLHRCGVQCVTSTSAAAVSGAVPSMKPHRAFRDGIGKAVSFGPAPPPPDANTDTEPTTPIRHRQNSQSEPRASGRRGSASPPPRDPSAHNTAVAVGAVPTGSASPSPSVEVYDDIAAAMLARVDPCPRLTNSADANRHMARATTMSSRSPSMLPAAPAPSPVRRDAVYDAVTAVIAATVQEGLRRMSTSPSESQVCPKHRHVANPAPLLGNRRHTPSPDNQAALFTTAPYLETCGGALVLHREPPLQRRSPPTASSPFAERARGSSHETENEATTPPRPEAQRNIGGEAEGSVGHCPLPSPQSIDRDRSVDTCHPCHTEAEDGPATPDESPIHSSAASTCSLEVEVLRLRPDEAPVHPTPTQHTPTGTHAPSPMCSPRCDGSPEMNHCVSAHRVCEPFARSDTHPPLSSPGQLYRADASSAPCSPHDDVGTTLNGGAEERAGESIDVTPPPIHHHDPTAVSHVSFRRAQSHQPSSHRAQAFVSPRAVATDSAEDQASMDISSPSVSVATAQDEPMVLPAPPSNSPSPDPHARHPLPSKSQHCVDGRVSDSSPPLVAPSAIVAPALGAVTPERRKDTETSAGKGRLRVHRRSDGAVSFMSPVAVASSPCSWERRRPASASPPSSSSHPQQPKQQEQRSLSAVSSGVQRMVQRGAALTASSLFDRRANNSARPVRHEGTPECALPVSPHTPASSSVAVQVHDQCCVTGVESARACPPGSSDLSPRGFVIGSQQRSGPGPRMRCPSRRRSGEPSPFSAYRAFSAPARALGAAVASIPNAPSASTVLRALDIAPVPLGGCGSTPVVVGVPHTSPSSGRGCKPTTHEHERPRPPTPPLPKQRDDLRSPNGPSGKPTAAAIPSTVTWSSLGAVAPHSGHTTAPKRSVSKPKPASTTLHRSVPPKATPFQRSSTGPAAKAKTVRAAHVDPAVAQLRVIQDRVVHAPLFAKPSGLDALVPAIFAERARGAALRVTSLSLGVAGSATISGGGARATLRWDGVAVTLVIVGLTGTFPRTVAVRLLHPDSASTDDAISVQVMYRGQVVTIPYASVAWLRGYVVQRRLVWGLVAPPPVVGSTADFR